jgi:hypothetical protein
MQKTEESKKYSIYRTAQNPVALFINNEIKDRKFFPYLTKDQTVKVMFRTQIQEDKEYRI